MNMDQLINAEKAKRAALIVKRDAHSDALSVLRAQDAKGVPIDSTKVVEHRKAKGEIDVEISAIDERIRELGRDKAADEAVHLAQSTITPVARYQGTRGGNYSESVGGTDSGMRAVEAAHARGAISEAAAQRVEALCRTGSESERTMAAEWAASAGSESYLRAFGKLLRNPSQGHLEFSGDELAAYQRVQAWRGQMSERAALTAAGWVLPLSVDPTVILTNAGAISGIADNAEQKLVSVGNEYRAITSAGATHEWHTDGAEVADGSPTVAEVSIPLFESSVYAMWTYALEKAAEGDLEFQLAQVVQDAVSVAWAEAFATGNGTSEPQGLITGLSGTASEVTGGGTEVIDDGDPLLLQNVLPARFSRDAKFFSHISVMNAFRGFETTNGALLYPELRETPTSLLSKPYVEESSMATAASINPAASAEHFPLVYSDLKRCYTIATGVGSIMEVVHTYGTNGRPTAGRGLFVWSRVGAKVVNANAARVLSITTTA